MVANVSYWFTRSVHLSTSSVYFLLRRSSPLSPSPFAAQPPMSWRNIIVSDRHTVPPSVTDSLRCLFFQLIYNSTMSPTQNTISSVLTAGATQQPIVSLNNHRTVEGLNVRKKSSFCPSGPPPKTSPSQTRLRSWLSSLILAVQAKVSHCATPYINE